MTETNGKVSQRNRARRVFAAGIAVILAVLGYGVWLSHGINDMGERWLALSQSTADRHEHLHDLHRHIVYGGFMHSFNQFVRTGDTALLDDAGDHIKAATRTLDAINGGDLTASERQAVADIRSAIDIFTEQITRARRSESVSAIDNSALMAALNTLDAETQSQAMMARMDREQQGSRTLVLASYGLLIVPLILLITYVLHRFVVGLMAAREEAIAAINPTTNRCRPG